MARCSWTASCCHQRLSVLRQQPGVAARALGDGHRQRRRSENILGRLAADRGVRTPPRPAITFVHPPRPRTPWRSRCGCQRFSTPGFVPVAALGDRGLAQQPRSRRCAAGLTPGRRWWRRVRRVPGGRNRHQVRPAIFIARSIVLDLGSWLDPTAQHPGLAGDGVVILGHATAPRRRLVVSHGRNRTGRTHGSTLSTSACCVLTASTKAMAVGAAASDQSRIDLIRATERPRRNRDFLQRRVSGQNPFLA